MLSVHRQDELAEMLASGDRSAIAKRLAGLFMAADHAFFYADLSTRTLIWSREIAMDLGYAPDAVGRSIEDWRSRIHADDVERIVSSVAAAMSSGVAVWVDRLRIVRADGTYAAARVRASILRDGTRMVGLVGSLAIKEGTDTRAELFQQIDDLLERSRASDLEALRRRLITRAVADAVYEWEPSTGMSTRSPGMQRLFAYSADAIEDSYSWWVERVHPDDRAAVEASLQAFLRGGTDDRWVASYRFRRKDGGHVPVHDRAYAIRDQAGAALRVIGAMSLAGGDDGSVPAPRPIVRLTPRQAQVLELVRAGFGNREIGVRLGFGEQSAKEHVSHLLRKFGAPNRAALVTAADASEIERTRRAHGDGVLEEIDVMFAVVRGPEHVVAAASPRLLGLTPGREVVGRTLRDAYPELSGHGVFEMLDHAYRTGQRYEGERVLAGIRSATGSSPVVRFDIEPLGDAKSRPDGLVMFGVEVTPRGRAGSSVLDAIRRQVESIGDIPIGAVVVDGAGRLLLMNAEARRILGSTLGDGTPVPAHASEYRLRDEHGRPVGPDGTALARALRGETVSRMDFVLRPPGSSADVVLRTSATPIRDAGQIVAVVLTFTEIERRAASSDPPPPHRPLTRS